jgi:peptidoglycan/xylan/chitin deacetylase (PgdA/CDA1 family)
MLFPGFIWNQPGQDKVLYLTFDDGPVPEATPLVLKYLDQYRAKATFFCVGENVTRYPGILNQVVAGGHAVGNHTFHHLNGWKTPRQDFMRDVRKCQQVLDRYYHRAGKPLMRPPYGRLKRGQWKALNKQFQIVMWNVLTGDFSEKIDAQTCLDKSIRYSSSGSVILFHDSVKTIDKLTSVLPDFLSHFSRLGFTFKPL